MGILRRRDGLIATVLLAVVMPLLLSQMTPASAATTQRLAGPDRYATAAAIAAAGTPQIGEAWLVRGDAFPDALAAANLGAPWEGKLPPLLLTERDRLPDVTRQALRDRGVSSVTIVGDTEVVSAAVEEDLRSNGYQVNRIGDVDRYLTAVDTYSQMYTFESSSVRLVDGMATLLMASGETFADGMSAAPLAASAHLPILLTRRDSLPESTRRSLDNEGTIEQVILIGGEAAIGPAVQADLESLGLTVRRIAGANRQATAVAIAEFERTTLGWTFHHFNLARGDTFPDALAGGNHSGLEESPTLLTVDPFELGIDTRSYLNAHAATLIDFHVLGDDAAVSAAVVQDAQTAATPP